MFDPDFFPTPPEVIERMLSQYRIPASHDRHWRTADDRPVIQSILEPSAGKGDILDWIAERCWSSRGGNKCNSPRLFAIEQSPDLAAILRSKGFRVIASDFLAFSPENRFDLIVMNPPFSDGAAHLLHAWEILDEGHLVCLLNAETIRNPYTRERRLLADIIQGHGSVEELGQCFRAAERPTDVEVVMIRLSKVRTERPKMSFEFDPPAGETEGIPDFGPDVTGTELMRPDQMGAMIRQYDKCKEAFANYLKARTAVRFYAQGVMDDYDLRKLEESCVGGTYTPNANERAFEEFKDGIRLAFWSHILQKLGMQKYLTSDLLDKFHQFVEEQGAMALTKEHIGQVLSMIMLNSRSIMDQAVVAVFDFFTAYHKDNRLHVEGWATNSAWKVNRKVILPGWVTRAYGSWSFSMYRRGEFGDIDKAMAYLTGTRIEDVVTIEGALEMEWRKFDRGQCQSTFFDIRYFKKGTVHLTFIDEALWTRFNVEACQGKGWLGHEA